MQRNCLLAGRLLLSQAALLHRVNYRLLLSSAVLGLLYGVMITHRNDFSIIITVAVGI
jgi:hypothetical protein